MNILYEFHSFQLRYCFQSGNVTTYYPDGAWSGCNPVPEDSEPHGRLLGITGGQHRLLHELAHHIVGIAMGNTSCPIVQHDAHRQAMPPDAGQLEWMITALSYYAMDKPMRHTHEWKALAQLAVYEDPFMLKHKLMKLLRFENVDGITVSLKN